MENNKKLVTKLEQSSEETQYYKSMAEDLVQKDEQHCAQMVELDEKVRRLEAEINTRDEE